MNAFVERGVRSDGLVALSREVPISAVKDQGMMNTTLMKWFTYPQGLAALRERATDGIQTWLTGFAPGLVPERPGPDTDDPAAAGWMRRFVRDVITTNPVSRSPLSAVQIYLIELALECVDWPAIGGPGTGTGRESAWSTRESTATARGRGTMRRQDHGPI